MSGHEQFDVESIREEYRRRDVAPQNRGVYSFESPAHARLVFERERAILRTLTDHLPVALAQAQILDVGASSGISLALLAAYGAKAEHLHGVDIVESRVAAGRATFPAFDLRVTDGVELPFADASFHLVQQITMLSSVPDGELRARIAAEMLRVLRPGGLVLSYDVAPLSVWPRLLNRSLSLLARRRTPPPATRAAGVDTERVDLRAPGALPLGELRALFAGTDERVVRSLALYRPLAERFAGRDVVFAAASSLPPFATTLLYAAVKR